MSKLWTYWQGEQILTLNLSVGILGEGTWASVIDEGTNMLNLLKLETVYILIGSKLNVYNQPKKNEANIEISDFS